MNQDIFELQDWIQQGTPSEMVERAFDVIEGWIDELVVQAADHFGLGRAHEALSQMPIRHKLDLFRPSTLDDPEVDDEDQAEQAERFIWSELYSLLELRPRLDQPDAEDALASWLEAQGVREFDDWDGNDAPEPLRSEMLLCCILHGSLIFLCSWFQEEARELE